MGRGQIQYLASLFHADAPNDVAPTGYNLPVTPAGLPSSPLAPAPVAGLPLGVRRAHAPAENASFATSASPLGLRL